MRNFVLILMLFLSACASSTEPKRVNFSDVPNVDNKHDYIGPDFVAVTLINCIAVTLHIAMTGSPYYWNYAE